MERNSAEILCKLTDDFYAANADAFSRTRAVPWPGWERVLREARLVAAQGEPATTQALEEGLFGNAEWPLTVLDIGCGNLRFAHFLRVQLPADAQLEYFAVDNCEALLPDEETLANTLPYVRFEKVDVLQRLVHGADLVSATRVPPCQLVVCFGLMHHVPGTVLRADLLDALVRCAKPGGYVAVTFWRFMDNGELAERALQQHAQALSALQMDPACLDVGDYLIGWQDVPIGQAGSIRYCHHFSDGEVDALAEGMRDRARVVARFSSDGRDGNLNTYLVLQVL